MPILNEKEFENFSIEGIKNYRTSPFNEITQEFLNDLSKSILTNKTSKLFPDLITFGFFCRRSNLKKNLERYIRELEHRQGYGLVLHIAPSNIPINFAFTFIFGLLSGNSNFVRMPSKQYEQNIFLLKLIDDLLDQKKYKLIKDSTIFFRSERNSANLKNLCKKTDGIVVWGGDETIKNFKELEKKVSCVEVYFPNRVSSLIIDSKSFINEKEKIKVLEKFYNDTYLVDQNACSSPSNIFWLGHKKINSEAQNLFWKELQKMLEKKRYSIHTKHLFDKYISAISAISRNNKPLKIKMHNADIWEIPDAHKLSSGFNLGIFSSTNIKQMTDMAVMLRDNEQTLTYFGCSPVELLDAIKKENCRIDRIVPIGSALDIGFIWDGKDVIRSLSKMTQIV